jgi:hypothetical protein
MKTALFQPARHVRAHSANTNETDVHTYSVILSEAKGRANNFRRNSRDSSLRSE